MSNQKRLTNPLLGPAVSGFSLSESFGPQAAVLVPSAMPVTQPDQPGDQSSVFFTSSPADGSQVLPQFKSPAMSPMGPPQLAPPAAGVFLLPPRGTSPGLTSPLQPQQTSFIGPPPTVTLTNASPSQLGQSSFIGPPPTMSPFPSSLSKTVVATKKSPYVPPPGIRASASATFEPEQTNFGTPAPPTTYPSMIHSSTSFPSFLSDSEMTSRNPLPPTLNLGISTNSPFQSTTQYSGPPTMSSVKVPDVAYHWFFRLNPPKNQGNQSPPQEVWKPFTMIDSCAIEEIFSLNPDTDELIPTDGGRYDVSIRNRNKTAVYWKDENNDEMIIRRCSWFYKSNLDGRWIPFDEDLSARLETEYVSGVETGRWNRRLEIGNGEYVSMHSESIIVHFPSNKSSMSGSLDDWGQVQPPTDPSMKPREVHRGLDGLPDIPDGETPEIDHLVFIVHGIGSVCDIRLRTISEVVDGFRELSDDMSQKHFQSALLSGKANRVEFLPVNWHRTLHGQDTGTDERLKPLTLRSIPKLRSFVNDTLLDILFYTSPIYCQTIINTVVSEINRMYTLFMARNESFTGQVSIIGHSLGSLIVFDILSHQYPEGGENPDRETLIETTLLAPEDQIVNSDLNLEQVFAKLEISEYSAIFTNEGIDMEALSMCNEDDLKEGGLPLGPRKKLLKYLEDLKNCQESNSLTGLEKYQQQSRESEVKYIFGPAGTGQPSVQYPRLAINFSSFYALGSPLGMFLAVRGIDCLGSNFSFPTCPRFFNIFHPFDPVAYRVEGLIKPEYGLTLRPVTIPHHKGRKRMHLELKDTVTKIMSTDIKQKLLDSVSATINAMYSIAVGNSYDASSKSVEQVVEQEMEQKARESDQLDSQNPNSIDSRLNEGRRIDYSLQEAPLESFNEYLFALASHLCYWESEDTCLMILKDIYSQLNIQSDDQLSGNTATPLPPPPVTSVPYLNAAAGRVPYVEPPAMTEPAPQSTFFNPADVMDLQAQPPSAPIPTFSSLSTPFAPGPAPSARIRPAYPKPVNPTVGYGSPPVLGMDPTAPPVADAKAIPPPPMMGFMRK